MSETLRIIQSIQAEEYWPNDPIAQEDYMFDKLCELMEENGLTGDEAHLCFTGFIASQRPDVTVIHIQQPVSGAFYE